ncbi:MAG: FHA domain-containing protein [bacterium]
MQTAFFGAVQSDGQGLILIRGEGLDGVTFQLSGRHVTTAAPAPSSSRTMATCPPATPSSSSRATASMCRTPAASTGSSSACGRRQPWRMARSSWRARLLRVQTGGLARADHRRRRHLLRQPHARGPQPHRPGLEGGRPGLSVVATTGSLTIGREQSDVEFPGDRFISGRHCRVDFTATGATVTDLSSPQRHLRAHPGPAGPRRWRPPLPRPAALAGRALGVGAAHDHLSPLQARERGSLQVLPRLRHRDLPGRCGPRWAAGRPAGGCGASPTRRYGAAGADRPAREPPVATALPATTALKPRWSLPPAAALPAATPPPPDADVPGLPSTSRVAPPPMDEASLAGDSTPTPMCSARLSAAGGRRP